MPCFRKHQRDETRKMGSLPLHRVSQIAQKLEVMILQSPVCLLNPGRKMSPSDALSLLEHQSVMFQWILGVVFWSCGVVHFFIVGTFNVPCQLQGFVSYISRNICRQVMGLFHAINLYGVYVEYNLTVYLWLLLHLVRVFFKWRNPYLCHLYDGFLCVLCVSIQITEEQILKEKSIEGLTPKFDQF